MIITDEKKLRQKSTRATKEESEEILEKLREELRLIPGNGLSAPQIGILKEVALVTIPNEKELTLVNPKIVKMSNPIVYPQEGCLSFPDRRTDTDRYRDVIIKDDSHPTWMSCSNEEAVAVQHEIDHLQGIMFFDREHKEKPKIGRNDKCPCGSGKKYKKCCGKNA